MSLTDQTPPASAVLAPPLSQQQLEQFQHDGYTLARGLIPLDVVRKVRAVLMNIYNGDHDWPAEHFQVGDPTRYRNPKGGYLPWGVQLPARRSPACASFADHPNLQAAMSQILGGPVQRHTDQMLIKPAILREEQGGRSFYHQDSYYWKLQPKLGCNVWIPLDEVGPKAICLAVMPGSQATWTLTEHEAYFDDPTIHSAVTGQAFTRWRIPFSKVDFSKEAVVPMQPGDGLFFSNYTWHRSEPNCSGVNKCAYAIAYKLKQTA